MIEKVRFVILEILLEFYNQQYDVGSKPSYF